MRTNERTIGRVAKTRQGNLGARPTLVCAGCFPRFLAGQQRGESLACCDSLGQAVAR